MAGLGNSTSLIVSLSPVKPGIVGLLASGMRLIQLGEQLVGPREQLLARVASIPKFEVPATISTDDLRAAYCELLVSVSVAKGSKSAEQLPSAKVEPS